MVSFGDDDPAIKKWRELLAKYHSLPLTDKKPFEQLKEETKNSNILTLRQKEALIARCDHAIPVIANPDKYKWKAPNVHKPAPAK